MSDALWLITCESICDIAMALCPEPRSVIVLSKVAFTSCWCNVVRAAVKV